MKKNVMRKNLFRTMRRSIGRYIAIVLIIALGAAIFVGLRNTKTDMIATGQKYMDSQNMFDLRLLSTYGWTQEQVDAVAKMAGVVDAEGSVSLDVLGRQGSGAEDAVYKLHSIPQTVSKVYLLGGRMPQSPDECLVDGARATDAVLGTEFVVSDKNESDTLKSLHVHSYTVVGYISTPLYMDMSRGSTTIGNGSVSSYVYIPMDAFDVDYFTEVSVTIAGDHAIYSDAFTTAMEEMAEALKPDVTVLADERFASVKADAEKDYADGWAEYQQGLVDYEAGREEVLQKLADALQELQSGQSEIDANRLTLLDGLKQLEEGQKTLDEQAATLITGRQELADAKAETYAMLAQAYGELLENQKTVSSSLIQVQDGLSQMEAGIAALEDGLAQLGSGLAQLEVMLEMMDAGIEVAQSALDAAKNAEILDEEWTEQLEQQLQSLMASRDEYVQQKQELEAADVEYSAQLEELQVQYAQLKETEDTLLAAKQAIEDGFRELEGSRAQAESEFLAAEATLESGQIQLDAAQKELDQKKAEADAGLKQLEEAQAELDAAWAEYESGKLDAEAELADAKAKLDEAETELADAREILDSMEPAEVFILNRNTNVGYLALDSNSDIVSGISKVFPFFFLLIAALVCITTMTRMVEEERTQIGTLKALGYSNRAIISKYIIYSGSAAIAGCGVGVVAGSVVFPMILWGAYKIIFNITPDLVLQIDWALCLLVVAAYTAVNLLVTWYCCRRTLREVPAELIRPKAPTTGRKIFLEYLPFWKRISFLNKVMLRNVFRYRQRFLMMLIGIGGCTALLLTGFGVGDSIVNLADHQFEEISVYDMEVYFSEGQTQAQQEAFRQAVHSDAADVLHYYQVSAELDFAEKTREVSLIAAENAIENFIHFRNDGQALPMPGVGEVMLSVGAAEAMGISVGDTVTLRDPDMRHLTLRVSEIYDNYVNNFAIVLPQTIQEQWGEAPAVQMAFVNVRSGLDVHAVGAQIAQMEGVMNVSVSQALAEQVGSMMDAMDAVVLTIVICAGLLAIVVLYNLTNINITERIREIATIKVLGFRAGESAAYVFKENLLLSGIGTVVGLLLGKLLLDFVMQQIRIDMVWFQSRITVWSVALSVVLTMLAACIVDFVLYFKLEKINMAEALKSVE